MKVGNKILGMAVGQKSIHVAEVSAKGDSYAVSICAEFVFPEGLSLSTPDKLGHEMQKFLKANRFSTKEVVMGLPAKRLVTRRKEIPAASPAVAASTLRLQAEGEFSSELDNLIMDFAGTPSTVEPSTVLLIATNKVLVDECKAMAEAAGLRVDAITSTTAALGRATSRLPGGDGLVLNMGPTGAELVIQHGLFPAHLKHLNMAGGGESMSMLANEIRRTVAAIPRNGTPMTLALWNSSETENPKSILEQRLSMPVSMPDVTNLVSTGSSDAQGYAPAVAVALSAMESGLAVDFLHSRLAPPKAPGMSMEKKLMIAGGVLLVGLVGFGYWDLNNKQSELDAIQSKIVNQTKKVAIADQQIQRFDDARSWLRLDAKNPALAKQPLFDAILRDLTQLFPAQGNTIWVTEISNKSNDAYSWDLSGKSTSQTYPNNIYKAMLSPQLANKFENPTPGIRLDNGTGLYSFTLHFTYKGAGYQAPAASKPGAKPKTATPE